MKNNLLKKLREAGGFTQEEVADRLHVATNTIQNWERDFRFKKPEDLHALLDLYGVSDVMRNGIVLDVYGRKGKDDTSVIMEKAPECNILQEVMDEIAGEKDVQYYFPYPLDKLCTCLDVVDNRMSCLETAISYLEGRCFGKRVGLISGWQTAFIIDSIGREYNAEAGAAEVYRIQENNEKVSDAFPLGDEEGWTIYSEEFHRELDCEEYADALHAKVEIHRSPSEVLEKALCEMKKDRLELRMIRERVLAYICQQGCWEKLIDISGLVDVHNGQFWEIVTIQRTGKAYKKTSTPKRMAWFLDPKRAHSLSVDRRPKIKKSRMDLYCGAVYQSQATVQQALQVLGRALDVMPFGYEIFDAEEWVDMCRTSTVLKEHLMQYM